MLTTNPNLTNCFNRIEPWYEPTDLLRESTGYVCKMSRSDHAFLSGIIKLIRPKKVVEIGVAQGGTTLLIAKTFDMLELPCDMYSLDLKENVVDTRDKLCEGEPIGCIYTNSEKSKFVNHSLMLGKTLAERLDAIGNDIDLVILDTAHVIPGEILDFLAILPYLSKNAMVVVHDINLCNVHACIGTSGMFAHYIATKVLFTTVVAEKYLNYDNGVRENIAAFKVNDDTFKYILNVFYALSHIWYYSIDANTLKAYRDIYVQHYPAQLVEIFDICVACESVYCDKLKLSKKFHKLETKIRKLRIKIINQLYKMNMLGIALKIFNKQPK